MTVLEDRLAQLEAGLLLPAPRPYVRDEEAADKRTRDQLVRLVRLVASAMDDCEGR